GLYKGAKPVMWSVVEQTALAEAEVEYKEHKSITIWARFPVVKTDNPLLDGADIVIWTTTPWTIPSNKALAYGEDIEYGVYEFDGQKIVLATSLADNVFEAAKIENFDLLGTLSGKDLAGTQCAHPLASCHPDRAQRVEGSSQISDGKDPSATEQSSSARDDVEENIYNTPRYLLPAGFVTDDAGTGFVHIAPSHGEDDFFLYLEHFGAGDIPDNVTDDGKFCDHVPLFAGLEVYTQKGEMGQGNFAVLKALAESGKLLAKGSVRHEYPHSWRSGAPLIFRTTPQWFISMSENGLRDRALEEIAKTQWIPAKGEARITAMIKNRPDWCISRQRAWGVPIALFVHKQTDEILRDDAVFTRITDIFKTEGSDSWWSRPASDFLGDQYNPDDYDQIFDIVDVWFESGSTHAFVLEDREDLQSPADLYLEGSDQHRGWFHSSLLESVGSRSRAPYKAVLTHGFVLDDKGYKMSKSRGNVIDPLKMMEQYGADILRLWTLTSDFSEDIRIGQDSLKNTGDLYRRIRNTLRFLLGALDGFTKEEMIEDFFEDPSGIPELEQLVLHQLAEMDSKLRDHIKNYDFMKLTKALHDFCNENLSAFYFDIRKDRLYCDAPDSYDRRVTRSVMAMIFNGLTAWLAPVLAFTAEEAWQHRPQGVFEDADSVHLREFPTVPESWRNDALAERWDVYMSARKVILQSLEEKRKDDLIKSSLEAHVTLYVTERYSSIFKNVDMGEVSILPKSVGLEVRKGASDMPSAALVMCVKHGEFGSCVELAEGEKCTRCWKVLPEVAQNDHICNRCADVVL
ncbi:MAG: isoleucine--tRNA ligase, partial [Bdellovibrionales bacterium]